MKNLIISALFISTNAFAVPYTILLESNKDYNKVLVKDSKADVSAEIIQLNPLTSQLNQKINKMLMAEVLEEIQIIEEDQIENFYIESVENVIEINKEYLTTTSSGSTYTGGAHPYNYSYTATLDLKKAAKVKPEEFQSAYITFDDTIAENQKEQAESKFKQLLSDKINSDEECKDAEITAESVWIGSVALTSNNLVITADLPHAYGACIRSIEIPYSQIKSMLKPGSLAAKLAK